MKYLLFISLAIAANSTRADDNSIDLQWSVCDSSPEAVLKKVNEEDAKEKSGSVTYFDRENGKFAKDGVSLRGKDKNGAEESSVKIRFNKHESVPEAQCEWDRYGQQENYTCEVTGNATASLDWSRDQLNFLNRYYDKAANLNNLKAFGPLENRKWKIKNKDFKATFDTVVTKEAGHLMEFSLKVPYAGSDAQYVTFSNWLTKKGVVLCARQESKTLRLFRALGIIK